MPYSEHVLHQNNLSEVALDFTPLCEQRDVSIQESFPIQQSS